MTDKEGMTQAEYDRQDCVDDAIYQLLLELSGKSEDELEQDMEHIGDLRAAFEDVICKQLKLMSAYDFYPWIKECGNCNYCEQVEDSDDGICRIDGGGDDAMCKDVKAGDLGCDRWQDADEGPEPEARKIKRLTKTILRLHNKRNELFNELAQVNEAAADKCLETMNNMG